MHGHNTASSIYATHYPLDLEVWFVCPCTGCVERRRLHEESGCTTPALVSQQQRVKREFDFVLDQPVVTNGGDGSTNRTRRPRARKKQQLQPIPGFYPTIESLKGHLATTTNEKTAKNERDPHTSNLTCPFVTCGYTFTGIGDEASQECFEDYFNHLLYQHASNICFAQPVPNQSKLCKSHFVKMEKNSRNNNNNKGDISNSLTSTILEQQQQKKKTHFERRQATVTICDSNLIDDYREVVDFVKSQLLMVCPTCGGFSHTSALYLKHTAQCKLKSSILCSDNIFLLYPNSESNTSIFT